MAEASETDNVGFATITVTNAPSNYCFAWSNFPWEDWISGVKVNGVPNTSGKSPYSNFTPLVFSAQIGATNSIALTTTWSYFTFDENWGVWIDYNHDQIFQPGEKVFEGQTARPPDGFGSKTLTGNFMLAPDALTGPARMRVVMNRGGSPQPCGIFPFGEVEDYTVDITANQQNDDFSKKAAVNAESVLDFTLFPNPAQDKITLNLWAWRDRPVSLELYNALGLRIETWHFDPVSDELISLDLGRIQDGQYWLRCVSPGVRTVAKQVVVLGRN